MTISYKNGKVISNEFDIDEVASFMDEQKMTKDPIEYCKEYGITTLKKFSKCDNVQSLNDIYNSELKNLNLEILPSERNNGKEKVYSTCISILKRYKQYFEAKLIGNTKLVEEIIGNNHNEGLTGKVE